MFGCRFCHSSDRTFFSILFQGKLHLRCKLGAMTEKKTIEGWYNFIFLISLTLNFGLKHSCFVASELTTSSQIAVKTEFANSSVTEGHTESEPEDEIANFPSTDSLEAAEGEEANIPGAEDNAAAERIPESEHSNPEPEAEGISASDNTTLIVLYSIVIGLIIIGNIIVVIIILNDKYLRRDPNNSFLVSLVLARACIGCFVVPARITIMYGADYLGSVLCKLCHFAATGSSVASVLSITGIAVMRYITIKYEKPNIERKVWVAIGLLWIFAHMYAIRSPIVFDLTLMTVTVSSSNMTRYTCDVPSSFSHLAKYFLISDIIVLFVLPSAVIIFCYTKVISYLGTASETMITSGERQGRRRSIHMIITLVILFIICSALPIGINLYMVYGGTLFEGFFLMEEIFYLISYSNAWINVIVLWHYRDDLKAVLFRMICHSKVNDSSPNDTNDDGNRKRKVDSVSMTC